MLASYQCDQLTVSHKVDSDAPNIDLCMHVSRTPHHCTSGNSQFLATTSITTISDINLWIWRPLI